MKRKSKIIILTSILFCFLLFGCENKGMRDLSVGSSTVEQNMTSELGKQEEGSTSVTNEEPNQDELVVYVCGEVCHSGVYHLPIGSRVVDAIEAAGGLKGSANQAQVNQAELVQDGQQIQIPAISEKQTEVEQTGLDTNGTTKIDLNHATKEQLMDIPGVGEAKASAIVLYREEHGLFQKIEDVMNITGIKEGMFQKMKDSITVNE